MSDRQRLIRDPQKKVRISSVQSNLVVIFGMLLATIVVTLMVFIHLSAQEVDAEKEMYRMETVEGALDYTAFAGQIHDMDEMTEFMERICPIKGTLYLLDQEKGTIDPGGLRYRVDRLLNDMENQPDPSKSVLRYRDSKLGKI